MNGLSTLSLLVVLSALSFGYGDEQSGDPFFGPEETAPPLADNDNAFELTFLSAQEALGVPEWSLNDWPDPILKEIRVYFRPATSDTTELIRLAIGTKACWIERRETEPARNGSWGKVIRRVALRFDLDARVRSVMNLAEQAELYLPPSPHELALIDSFTTDSIWILDTLSPQHRRSIIIRNADMVSTLSVPPGRAVIRNFAHYQDIWRMLNEILSEHSKEGGDVDESEQK